MFDGIIMFTESVAFGETWRESVTRLAEAEDAASKLRRASY
jgi:hypothetical protein